MPARVARLSSPIEGAPSAERRLDARERDLLAAADDGVLRRELEIEARRRIETPERFLEASMARKRTACAH